MALSQKFGPGLLVTAAFIGPGTVTTASAAGADFGFALIWALLFSLFATWVLQEMAARLGLVTRSGLAQAMRSTSGNAFITKLAMLLVIAAIGFGNAAYEAGNIAGAALAVTNVTGVDGALPSLAIGGVSAIMLWSGRYQLVERLLIALVVIMSLVFIVTAVLLSPDLGSMASALLPPDLPSGSTLVALALVGTTVVPYNLFLHANAVSEKWPPDDNLEGNLRESRWDTGLSIGLGGLVTLAIMSTSVSAFFMTGSPFDAGTIGNQLTPVLGPAGKYIFAAGLFAGGLTSAITAPLAASFAVCGALGWSLKLDSAPFRLVWGSVLLTGTVYAATGNKPLAAILFAQAANGFLLPVVAIFLLVVMNQKSILGKYCNRPLTNIMGLLVVLITVALGAVKLLGVVGLI